MGFDEVSIEFRAFENCLKLATSLVIGMLVTTEYVSVWNGAFRRKSDAWTLMKEREKLLVARHNFK